MGKTSLVLYAAVLLLVVGALAWMMSQHARVVDERAAVELALIRARAHTVPVVPAVPGVVAPPRVERDAARAVVRDAAPVVVLRTETTAQIPSPPGGGECPAPEVGCEIVVTGWQTKAGNLFATGHQTLRWRWPGGAWQESAQPLTEQNSAVTVRPAPWVIHASAARGWLAGPLLGVDGSGHVKYGAVAGRQLGARWGVSLSVVGLAMAGGGDVLLAGGIVGAF